MTTETTQPPNGPESSPLEQQNEAKTGAETRPRSDTENGEPERGRRGAGVAWFALLLALVALAGTAWMWWQDQAAQSTDRQQFMDEIARLEAGDSQLSLKLNQLREDLESTAGSGGDEMQALQQRMLEDRSQLGTIEQSIREQAERSVSMQAAAEALHGRLLAAEAALSNMSARELDAGGELDLLEVDYLLRLADERLGLFGDTASADRALEVADRHLAAIDNPTLIGVRREIAAAREALSATDMPDLLSLAHRLDALQAAIPSLPFPGSAAAVGPAAEDAGDGWWEKLKGALGSLVTVRRNTEEADPLSLEDKDYVRQRLWLQLEVAHLALMRRDQEAFRRSLARASETLSTWFDGGDERVRDAIGSLASLAELQLRAELPDISRPWSMLRSLSAAPPPPAAPASVDVGAGAVEEEPGPVAPATQDVVPAAEAGEPVESDAGTADEAGPGEGDG